MEKLSIIELYQIKSKLIKEGMTDGIMFDVLEAIKVIENKLVESEVFGHPTDVGHTPLGPRWASGDNAEKGYINIPYNPSGSNRMMQKIPVMGKEHGAMTGNRTREKRIDMKALKAALKSRKEFTAKEPGERKVMSFDNFEKDKIASIKKESFDMNKSSCDRCGESTNNVTIMSVFNTDVICKECKDLERKDPDYQLACDIEREEVRKGNTNFQGAFPNYKPLDL